nr:glycosyltransferase family 9 protein [Armatimonadota bacterium]
MPQKILVVNMNYLGDALMTTPALAALRRACPDAQIDTVAGAGGAVEVLRGNPDINAVIPRTGRKSGERCRQLYQMLRSERYTDVVILPPLPVYALMAWLAQTPNRVGRARYGMDFFLTRRQPVTATHMADMMLQTMPVAGETALPRRLSVALTAGERDAARSLMAEVGLDTDGPIMAVNAGTSATRAQKRWPAEHFAAALDALADVPSVLIGAGAEEVAIAERILALSGRARPVNLVGRTGIKELAALLERCAVLLTADSGPMHLATAVGTP